MSTLPTITAFPIYLSQSYVNDSLPYIQPILFLRPLKPLNVLHAKIFVSTNRLFQFSFLCRHGYEPTKSLKIKRSCRRVLDFQYCHLVRSLNSPHLNFLKSWYKIYSSKITSWRKLHFNFVTKNPIFFKNCCPNGFHVFPIFTIFNPKFVKQ